MTGLWTTALCASLLGTPGTLTGTLTVDRAEVIRRAIKQNPQAAAARAELVRARARQGMVRAARFPEIEFTVGIAASLKADLVDGTAVESTRSAYDFRFQDLTATFGGVITLTQPLYTFGKIDLRGEAADRALDATKAQIRMTEVDIAFEAVKLYEAHLYAQTLLLFVKDLEDIGARSLEETEFLLEEGSPDVSIQDKLRLQSAMGLARIAKAQAKAGISQSIEGLRAYLGLPAGTKVQLTDSFLIPISAEPTSFETMVGWAKNNRPEFAALKNGITAYEKLADAEEADYYPDIFLYGYISGAYTPGREFITTRYVLDPLGHFLPVGLIGARWTVQWDMAGQQAEVTRTDAYRLINLLKWAELGIPAELNKPYQDVVSARENIKDANETIKTAKQWLVRASADYGAGLGSSRDLTDAVQAYVLLKNAEIEAVYKLNVALAELAKVTGTLDSGTSSLYPGKGVTQ